MVVSANCGALTLKRWSRQGCRAGGMSHHVRVLDWQNTLSADQVYRRGQRLRNRQAGSLPHELRQGLASGFTLIELLVVMSIITILASMTLPSLSRAKEKAKTITCVNNLHQIDIAMKLFVDDNDSRFPKDTVSEPFPGGSNLAVEKDTVAALGGRDPVANQLAWFPSARVRPLFPYLQFSEVFRCPQDKGQICKGSAPAFKPSNWQAVGCSYQYNAGRLITLQGGGFRKTPDDVEHGIADKRENWPPEPSFYILMHEPPARVYGCSTHGPIWHQWHYARGDTDIQDPVYARQQFVSPVLFVDGHVSVLDFSKALSADPFYPYERTRDWIWYKPADGSSAVKTP